MKTKNLYWIIAGMINLFTAFLHLIGGQITIVQPMIKSSMPHQASSEMLAAWHLVTVFLFLSSLYFLKFGMGKFSRNPYYLIQMMSYAYLAFGAVFILICFFQTVFAPQWTLLMPIGIFGFIGLQKNKV
jgi:hypothetical protein